jgi:hypothetical protein
VWSLLRSKEFLTIDTGRANNNCGGRDWNRRCRADWDGHVSSAVDSDCGCASGDGGRSRAVSSGGADGDDHGGSWLG